MNDKRKKRDTERDVEFSTVSSYPVDRLYTQEDLAEGWDPDEKLGSPGEYPYTRGIHPTMHRGRLWTMRQFAGFGSARETNERFKYLLGHGQGGLSVAFDLPTLMGRDSDDELACGEVGKEGVAVDSLQDMERLFEGIPLDKVSTSMTINAPAAVDFLQSTSAVAEKQGVSIREADAARLQNDILKEYIAQKEWIYPPRPSMRIITDLIAFCTRHVPQVEHDFDLGLSHPRGRLDRCTGARLHPRRRNRLCTGWASMAGLDVDSFAPRLSFFFNSHNDFFEEVCEATRCTPYLGPRVMKRAFQYAKDIRSPWTTVVSTPRPAGCLADRTAAAITTSSRVTVQALAGCAGRHPVPAHGLLRRGSGAALGRGRHGGAANPTDPGGGVRRDATPSTLSAARTSSNP